ncbi:shikimate kinase [Roseofilum sp. BLCC_M91]|uniref:Shikimate kinase n=1 Tax=Roseofilum halophilum BLCC-M91 TaxID=3022259 RepID=A0ABT7BF37_9CYAN|nr:shikimate kinase [Roseofilum halophilum]MDJ1177795.1 shikimate kinase [Roseofilum halophilum BLCC-M91]
MNNTLKNCSLFLVGMMGAGKTTVGQELAKRFNYRFFDTDTLIERVTGTDIPQLFATQGEERFRQLETQILGQLSAQLRSVISTGGGIVLKPENWGYLRHGIVVWLDVPPEVLYDRLKTDETRPLLKTENPLETLQKLCDRRQSLYAQADLHLTLTGAESPEKVTDTVLTQLPRILKSNSVHN